MNPVDVLAAYRLTRLVTTDTITEPLRDDLTEIERLQADMDDYVWVVIDVGCIQCGVESEPIGIYPTAEEAEKTRREVSERTPECRDGGHSIPKVFKMAVVSGD